jgi:hypothetical protein
LELFAEAKSPTAQTKSGIPVYKRRWRILVKFSVQLLASGSFVILFAICFVACNGPSSNPPNIQHLYVGNDNSPGQILQYDLPITNTSTPVVTVTNAATVNLVSVAVDSNGNLATGDNAGNLATFNKPITASSLAAATFHNGIASNDGQLVFNAAGDLFAPSVSANVNLFTHPLTSASVPTQSITGGGTTSAIGAGLDSSGNLIIANSGAAGSNLAIFAPPFTGVPVVTATVVGAAYRKLTISSTQLFVCTVGGGTTGGVEVYNLPLTAASVPAFTMTNVNTPEGIALDRNGNLYVGNLTDATIRVFAPPFSASSTPTVTLTVSGTFALFGIAIGK